MAENSEIQGAYLRQQLLALQHPHILVVRGRGLFNAIVIEHPNKEAAWDICMDMKENGLLAKPTHGDRIRFAPPLTITRAQVDDCIAIIAKSMKKW
jgi:ornithine--oxo-acid transaminase